MNAIDATRLAGIVPQAAQKINVTALAFGGERYVFLYEDGRERDVFAVVGRFAANPELAFTWNHAAIVSIAVKHKADERCKGK